MKRPGGFGSASAGTKGRAGRAEDDAASDIDPGILSRLGRTDGAATTEDEPVVEARADRGDEAPHVVPLGPSAPDVRAAARARKRALREEMRRFTARSRRRRLVWLVSLGSVVVVALLAVIAAYSPLVAVRTITVEGAELVDADAIVSDLSSQIGVPLTLVDESAVKAELVKYPLIQSYSIEASLPSTLVIRLVERVPVGVLASGDGYTLVDAAGVVMQTSAEPIAGYPVLDTSSDPSSAGFAAAVAVVRALPDEVRAQLGTVTATTADDVTLTMADSGAVVIWGNADKSSIKAVILERLMAQYPPDGVASYDVSSTGNGIVTPR